MARARNIKPGFYTNPELIECSVWARLIYPGLWMLADREGRLEDRPKKIKMELLPADPQEVEPLLQELEAHGFLVRYRNEDGRFIQIVNFKKHQSPHFSEKASVIKPPDSGKDAASSGATSEKDATSSDALSEKASVIKPPDSGGNTGEPPEKGGLKRGSQPPDILIPDSPNPENASLRSAPPAAAAASPPTEPERPPLTAKDKAWAMGVALLGDKPASRTLLGRLARDHGDDMLAEVLAEATLDPPHEPKAWLIAACEARAKSKPRAVNGRSEQPDMLADPTPQWALDAGFRNRFEAENEGCRRSNAHLFRDGRLVAA